MKYQYQRLYHDTTSLIFVDRAYIYDNSVEDHLPQLLFRMTEGKVFKQYTDDIPEWAQPLMNK